TPLLDPLKVHHTEYRARIVDAGFDRVRTTNRSVLRDPDGRESWGTSWHTVLWPRRKDVWDAQDWYMALSDQILLMQKELMLLKAGHRFVRGDTVMAVPEYVPMLCDPWSTSRVLSSPIDLASTVSLADA